METPEEKAAREAEEAKAAKAKADEEAAAAAKAEEAAKLGAGGQKAIDEERAKARAAVAEQKKTAAELKDALAKLEEIEKAKLTETERLQQEAEQGKQAAKTATDKLRRANLTVALAGKDHGLADPRAAARLIEGVEFDDQDEPTNLTDRVKALVGEYPLLKGKGVQHAPNLNGGGGGDGGDTPPELTAEELDVAKSFGMTPEEYAAAKDPQYQAPAPAKT